MKKAQSNHMRSKRAGAYGKSPSDSPSVVETENARCVLKFPTATMTARSQRCYEFARC
jgi:hypothetical protein